MASTTIKDPPAPVETAIRNLRVCRGYMLGCCSALDAAGETEAVHSLRMALCSLDDCLTALGAGPEEPTQVLISHMDDMFVRQETLAEDRRMDRSMDRWDR